MQDNLLRKEDTNALNLVVHENPHQKRILEIENTINTLFDIRLSLSVKKIVSPFIKKDELVKMIDDATKSVDDIVKKEIDNVFDEYLSPKKDNNSVSLLNAEDKVSLSLEEMIGEAFKDAGREKGSSKSLNNGHFKNTELQKDN